jgi:hypothetical protein
LRDAGGNMSRNAAMDIYDGLFGASEMLFEQVVRRLAETLTEEGPMVAILDGNGGCWTTSPQRCDALLSGRDMLKEYCHRVADGWEPVTGTVDGWGIMVGQLRTEGRHHGYVVIGLPAESAAGTAVHQGLLEVLLNQVNAIADLIDKNNQLYHQQLKIMSESLAKEPTCVN